MNTSNTNLLLELQSENLGDMIAYGDLIHIADDHLYLAKGAGRNQVCSQGSRWGEVN